MFWLFYLFTFFLVKVFEINSLLFQQFHYYLTMNKIMNFYNDLIQNRKCFTNN